MWENKVQMRGSVTEKGLGLRRLCPGMVWNVWALNFIWEKFHNTSPGDFESTRIKAGDSKTEEGLRSKRQDHSNRSEWSGAAFWLTENLGK